MNRVFFTVFLVLLSGCINEKKELALLPLYQGCEPYIDRYEKKMGYDDLQFKVRFFEQDVITAPGVIGYLTLYGGEIDEFELEALKNGFKMLCYPMYSTTIEAGTDYFGYLALHEIMHSKGIKNSYMVYNSLTKNIDVYYNGTADYIKDDILY